MEKKPGLHKGLQKKFVRYLHGKKSDGSSADKADKNREITVANIEEHILQKRFMKASQDLIALEHKIVGKTDEEGLEEKKQEIECLYERLGDEVFKVVKVSIVEDDACLLADAVQAIVEQEAEDTAFSLEATTEQSNTVRPRKWKQKWLDCVEQSVREQIKNITEIPSTDSTSPFSKNFVSLGKTLKTDLTHVVQHLKPLYPAELDVCNTYANYYHVHLKSYIERITAKELNGKDIHFVLCWIHDIYPNILKDPALNGLIEATKLGSILPPDRMEELENKYIFHEVQSIKEWMDKSLKMEIQRWKDGMKPLKLGNYYHSELHIDIIQSYNGGIQRAEEIGPKMSQDLSPFLENVLKDILMRYKILFEEYKEQNKDDSNFRSIIIANINCCWNFRDFIEHRDTLLQPTSKEIINGILTELQMLGLDTLHQDLFIDLKVHFKMLTRESGLHSHQTMLEIIRIVENHILSFRRLVPSCYTEVIDKIHLNLVKEYVTRLLKKKISIRDPEMLKILSSEIKSNADLIQDFFSLHESQAVWLNAMIPRLAEIIKLQDVGSIQIEVAALANNYPDIGKKHIKAILHIKGNLSRSDVKSVLGLIKSMERQDNSTPPFFSLITTPKWVL
ncbi:tumor necrosis factor alpha-induced 2 [Pelobates cultripes]|uniref:Tumor necrosis factor alpha-induced 2 n=1 Tax=Pelobates cultripes TaxID=61616 RepID=A0AAD1TN02_PELCU|nr:tumor necrosis factor alpha-induced 2 [Pelobates cultripes]